MKGLIFFGLGVAVTAVVVLKAKDMYRKATPQGVQEHLVKQSGKAQDRLQDFFATMKQAAAEREVELRDALGMPQPGEEVVLAPTATGTDAARRAHA